MTTPQYSWNPSKEQIDAALPRTREPSAEDVAAAREKTRKARR